MSTWTDSPSPRPGAPDLRSDENSVRLLLVENSSVCARLLLDALELADRGHFEVECADCLTSAEWSIAHDDFDAVVVDLMVSGDGAAGVDAVCEIAHRLPVIALTGIRDAALDEPLADPCSGEDPLVRIGRADLPAIILRAVHRHRRLGVCGAEPTICRIPSP